MLHSITGLTLDQIQLTLYTLNLIKEYYCSQKKEKDEDIEEMYAKEEEAQELSSSYIMLIDSIDSLLLLVINELFSTRAEIIHWERMQKGSQWDLKLYQWNSYVYRLVFPYKNAKKIVIPINDKHDMIYHIESLKDDFNNLAILLSKLHECIGIIREITVRIDNLHLFKSSYKLQLKQKEEEMPSVAPFDDQKADGEEGYFHATTDDFPYSGLGGRQTSIVEQIVEVNHQSKWKAKINHIEKFTKFQLIRCIHFLISSVNEHIPILLTINNPNQEPQDKSSPNNNDDIISSENPLLRTNFDDLQETSELIHYSNQLSTFFREYVQNNAHKVRFCCSFPNFFF
jgi:hypothetical protein